MSGTGACFVEICPFPFAMQSTEYASDWHDGVLEIK